MYIYLYILCLYIFILCVVNYLYLCYVHWGGGGGAGGERESCYFSSGQCSWVYYCECSEGQSDPVLPTGPVINMTHDGSYHVNYAY